MRKEAFSQLRCMLRMRSVRGTIRNRIKYVKYENNFHLMFSAQCKELNRLYESIYAICLCAAAVNYAWNAKAHSWQQNSRARCVDSNFQWIGDESSTSITSHLEQNVRSMWFIFPLGARAMPKPTLYTQTRAQRRCNFTEAIFTRVSQIDMWMSNPTRNAYDKHSFLVQIVLLNYSNAIR